jgi:hypothetical protein
MLLLPLGMLVLHPSLMQGLLMHVQCIRLYFLKCLAAALPSAVMLFAGRTAVAKQACRGGAAAGCQDTRREGESAATGERVWASGSSSVCMQQTMQGRRQHW